MLVQYPEFYRVAHSFQGIEDFFMVGRINIGNGITNLAVGLEVLTEDIDLVFGEDTVDLCKDPCAVFVDMDEAVCIAEHGELQLGEIQAALCRAGIDVLDNFCRYSIGGPFQ